MPVTEGASPTQHVQDDEHSSRSVEVLGFAGYVASALGYCLFVLWAYLPEAWLHHVGVTYYPVKHWAVALPAWLVLSLVCIFWAYEGLNLTLLPGAEWLGKDAGVAQVPSTVAATVATAAAAATIPSGSQPHMGDRAPAPAPDCSSVYASTHLYDFLDG